MRLRHVGSRPENSVKHVEGVTGLYMERLSDETVKFWNTKTMNSGCGNVITVVKKDIKDGLIYCPRCGEMANEKQFIKE